MQLLFHLILINAVHWDLNHSQCRALHLPDSEPPVTARAPPLPGDVGDVMAEDAAEFGLPPDCVRVRRFVAVGAAPLPSMPNQCPSS